MSLPKSTLIFLGVGHTAFLELKKRKRINKNLMDSIIQLKKNKGIKTVIAERNDDEIKEFIKDIDKNYCSNVTCAKDELADTSFIYQKQPPMLEASPKLPPHSPKKSILDGSEIYVAIWTAKKENLKIKGGEPLDTDIINILKMANLSDKDYAYTCALHNRLIYLRPLI